MKAHLYKITAIVLILLNGCAAYYPQMVDIPLIREKGDIRIDAGYFLAHNFDENGTAGVHGTFSAGLTNMVAIQGYINMDLLGRLHAQGASGLFKGLENNAVIELYGGYGIGAGHDNNYSLAFSQFNVGKTDVGGANIDYGLGLKGGYLFCNYENSEEYQTIHQKNGCMFEPSLFFRVGGRRVKFCTKVNYLWTKTVSDVYYYPLSVSLGVNIYLRKNN